MFPCKFAEYFQNTLIKEHLWRAVSKHFSISITYSNLGIVCNLENLDQVEKNNYNQLDGGYIMANDSPNRNDVSKVKFI